MLSAKCLRPTDLFSQDLVVNGKSINWRFQRMPCAISTIRSKPAPCCLLCHVEGIPLYEQLRDVSFGAPGSWHHRRCSKCGLIWLDPMPLPDDLHLAYQSYFTHIAVNKRPTARARFRDFLYTTYCALQRVPAALVGLARAQDRIRMMYLNDLRPGRILDVGCGDGTFLDRMGRAGWTVAGVDFDEEAINTARVKYGLHLHHGDLFSARFPECTFDAVTLKHVIEHVPDPIALLSEVRRVLKVGGRVVVITPNSSSFGHQMFRADWFGIDSPRHLHILSLRTLAECARRASFTTTRVSSTAANADVFIGGSHSIRAARRNDARVVEAESVNLWRGLVAMYLQCREQLLLQKHPEYGEEAVLISEK